MNVRWLAPLALVGVLACDKKPVADPPARTAAVIEKAPEAKAAQALPPEIKPVVAPEPKAAEPVVEAKAPEAKPPEPVVEAKPEPEAKPAEPVVEAKEPEPEAKPAGGGRAEVLVPDLLVTDKAVTDAIVDRMPSERKSAWKIGEDQKLIGWFEFKNPGSAVDLELVWKKNGTVNWRFPTSVGSGKNWRTWAEKRITKKDAGDWTVEVVDANGHVYDRVDYKVE